jgi:metal-responsive CopG/Arc/MetJ family transcriptional regulator
MVKVKTSITLPDDLLEEIDRAGSNRSMFLERAARQYLAQMEKSRREAQDSAILEAHSERLNKEALDVLEYQDLP